MRIHIHIYIYIYSMKTINHTNNRSSRMWCLRMWWLIIVAVILSYTYMLPYLGSHNYVLM